MSPVSIVKSNILIDSKTSDFSYGCINVDEYYVNLIYLKVGYTINWRFILFYIQIFKRATKCFLIFYINNIDKTYSNQRNEIFNITIE